MASSSVASTVSSRFSIVLFTYGRTSVSRGGGHGPIVAQTRIQFMPNRFARLPVSSIAAILLAAMVVPAGVSSGDRVLTGSRPFQTERSFQLPGGRARGRSRCGSEAASSSSTV